MTRAAWWMVIAAMISALLIGWYVLVGGLSYKPTGGSLDGPSQAATTPSPFHAGSPSA